LTHFTHTHDARLEGKTAFVTAAGQGIGRAVAEAFAREGARVIATDLNDRCCRPAGEEGRLHVEHGSTCWTRPPLPPRRRHGKVNVLFNGAGFVHHGTVLDCTEDEWDFAFDLNVRSMYRTIKAFLPGMLARGNGSIINVASGASSVKAAANRFVYGHQGGRHRPDQVGGAGLHHPGRALQRHLPRHGGIALAARPHRRPGRQGPARRLEQVEAMFVARQPMGRLGHSRRDRRAGRAPGE
jgi:2-keto-3-deoxy-L-fuconate dehydrogenase